MKSLCSLTSVFTLHMGLIKKLVNEVTMRKYIRIVLVCLWLFPGLYAQKLRVATYNIRYENNGDVKNGNGWKQRCPVIVELIRFHDLDIFGAQEETGCHPITSLLWSKLS